MGAPLDANNHQIGRLAHDSNIGNGFQFGLGEALRDAPGNAVPNFKQSERGTRHGR